MLGYRPLLWAVLLCALILPLAVQANANSLPLAAPATDYQISAQKCDMGAGCACPCCQHNGNNGRKCGCRSISIRSLPGLLAGGTVAPFQDESPNYTALIGSAARIIIVDIYRPPKS